MISASRRRILVVDSGVVYSVTPRGLRNILKLRAAGSACPIKAVGARVVGPVACVIPPPTGQE